MIDGFESDQQYVAFLGAIRQRIVPIKFTFAGAAATTHEKWMRHASYKRVMGIGGMVADCAVKALSPSAGRFAFLEIGPGNGVTSASVISEFQKREVKLHRWVGFDCSSILLDRARHEIGTAFPDLPLYSMLWDIEAGPLDEAQRASISASVPAIAGLLGNTLGNVLDPTAVLRNVRASLHSATVLLVGVTMYDGDRSDSFYLTPYDNPTFRRAILEPFRLVGFDLGHTRLEMSFSHDRRAVVGRLICKKTYRFIPGALEPIELEKGAEIECFLSRRFDAELLSVLLESSGWKPIHLTTDGAHHGIVAARAKDE
jgi:L-histidine N-alpha-methyltransferase